MKVYEVKVVGAIEDLTVTVCWNVDRETERRGL